MICQGVIESIFWSTSVYHWCQKVLCNLSNYKDTKWKGKKESYVVFVMWGLKTLIKNKLVMPRWASEFNLPSLRKIIEVNTSPNAYEILQRYMWDNKKYTQCTQNQDFSQFIRPIIKLRVNFAMSQGEH